MAMSVDYYGQSTLSSWTPLPTCLCPYMCFLDTKRGQPHVYGDQTLCVREPHSPGELCESGLESWTGESNALGA